MGEEEEETGGGTYHGSSIVFVLVGAHRFVNGVLCVVRERCWG